MKSTTDLTILRRAITCRIERLRAFFLSSRAGSHKEKNAAFAFCVIELDNIIINLHREFLVSSLYLRCRTCLGHKVSHNGSFASPDAAGLFIMSVLEPIRYRRYNGALTLSRREETKIREPTRLVQIASAIALSNSNSVITALSLNSAVFVQIATFRNFYAHRNNETAQKLRRLANTMGIVNPGSEWDTVSQLLPGSPATLFESWAFDVELFTEFLLE